MSLSPLPCTGEETFTREIHVLLLGRKGEGSKLFLHLVDLCCLYFKVILMPNGILFHLTFSRPGSKMSLEGVCQSERLLDLSVLCLLTSKGLWCLDATPHSQCRDRVQAWKPGGGPSLPSIAAFKPSAQLVRRPTHRRVPPEGYFQDL